MESLVRPLDGTDAASEKGSDVMELSILSGEDVNMQNKTVAADGENNHKKDIDVMESSGQPVADDDNTNNESVTTQSSHEGVLNKTIEGKHQDVVVPFGSSTDVEMSSEGDQVAMESCDAPEKKENTHKTVHGVIESLFQMLEAENENCKYPVNMEPFSQAVEPGGLPDEYTTNESPDVAGEEKNMGDTAAVGWCDAGGGGTSQGGISSVMREAPTHPTPAVKEEEREQGRKPRLGESWCPVCGLTLRPGELETHFTQEVDKLVRLPQSRRPSQRPPTPSPSTSSEGNGATPRTVRTRSGRTSSKQWEMYQRVKSNRQVRTRVKRRRNNTAGDSNDHQQDDEYYDDDDDDDVVQRRTCPVCDKKVLADDINTHISKCLNQAEDEEVDVEGENEGGSQYEEYEWCGQTRVRATQMLRAEGQLHALGTKVQQGCEDEVVDVVDDDSTSVYGPPQYTDADLPPYNPDSDMDEEPSPSSVSNHTTTTLCNNSERTTIDFNLSSNTSSVSTSRGSSGSTHTPSLWSADSINPPQTDGPSASSISNTPAVVEALRARLQELEQDETSPRGRYSCRVCHSDYMKPLVSVLCWHVHCERCWLCALSAKKLCPQCSAITSSSDLRRVYF
ncbi:E3 ubiquitin-protein ligase RNF220-like [Homarus americanus]|uniref:E3 ubiquitin-protein ligase RNF220-like n=1 Tax=Homarus americanus TaxID=6706 RepID=UPI001C4421E6|nr:E3 ubiquitin-protein ligase RNF220-like [Homarus americanus]